MTRTPDGGIAVSYVVTGELDRVRVPAPRAPRFADELWRHTCLELFVKEARADAYREFNFSPSGEWAAYAFERYRERNGADTPVEPRFAVQRDGRKLELNAVVPAGDRYPADAALSLGLSAVIEETDGTLSYWALKHPAPRPDFHHAAAFALRLDGAGPRFSRSASNPGLKKAP